MQDQPNQCNAGPFTTVWLVLEPSPDGRSYPICAFTNQELAAEQADQIGGMAQSVGLYNRAIPELAFPVTG